MSTDASLSGPIPDEELLTPLEQDILEEYERLSKNMKNLAHLLDTLSAQPSAEILDSLRQLERKTTLVFTALKASVYSIVLQQEIYSEDRPDRGFSEREDRRYGDLGEGRGYEEEDRR